MFDLDNFKDINDTLGHQVGDAVLTEIARLTKATVRSVDVVSRWGGDEFLILCPETFLSEAYTLAERLQRAIENHRFPRGLRVTASIGVCELSPQEGIEDLLRKVDEALYKAKKSGKNTVKS
jgi:diguanylate cyclase (GGDEF)-like protein